MAEIIPRGKNKHLVRVFLGRTNGRARYHNKVVHGGKKAAEKYAREAEVKRDLGQLDKPASEDPVFGKFLDDWMREFKKGTVRERTYEGYDYTLKQYVRPYLGKDRISELTARRIQGVYNELTESGLSPRTVKFAHGLIKEALDQAVVEGLLPANPANATRRPTLKKKSIQVFDPEEAGRFIKAAKKDRDGIVFWFALATGMRPEEYLGLKWTNLDLENHEVHVRQTIYFPKGGGWKIEEVKTESSIRTIGFERRLAQALAEHKRNQAAQRLRLGKKYQNNGFVFATPKGQPHNLRNLTLKHLVPVIERAKIDGPRNLYRLRHSFVTLSLLWGIDPKTVSRAAGHSSVAFTLDTYQHVLPSVRKDAAEKIGKMLFGAV
jgi:integrase